MTLPLLLCLLALALVVICLGLIIQLYKQNQRNQADIQSLHDTLSILTQKHGNLSEELHEVRSASYGMNSRVKDLVKQVDLLQSAQQQLAEQDPQSRFYNKAAKLINDGASLQEVMQECDMPAAEAELLFNLHSNKA